METTKLSTARSNPRYVQACITNVSFPQDLPGLRQMLHKHRGLGTQVTDLDVLIDYPDQPTGWTAPSWMTTGDLLFFYHAFSAPERIARLQRELQRQDERERRENRNLIEALGHAAVRAKPLHGHVFAVAEISGRPVYERLADDERHFQGRIFAPFERVHHFKHPLSMTVLSEIGIAISRQSALTPLEGQQLTRLKERLASTNQLPACVADALPGGAGFRDVSKATWRTISCAPDQRFVHEGQLRSYLINYLLDEIKDARTLQLEECACYRGTINTGRADYFITLGGRLVPVEAKLNIFAERDLPSQLAQYTQLDWFQPTLGKRRDTRFQTQRATLCLVIDQSGLYVTRAGSFVACDADHPLLTRTQLGQLTGAEVRDRLLPLLDE